MMSEISAMKLDDFNQVADLIGLKKRSREAVWLMEVEGMTGYFAAQQMDISESTVSRAHTRFRLALRKLNALSTHLPL
jgi:DNA-directed RNA polymerase specialized sigma24 family protein